MARDWYAERDKLRSGQVFRTCCGDVVRLDRSVPGDGTKWYADDWWGGSWAHMDSTIEPGDLVGDPIEDTPEAVAKALRA